MKFIFLLMLVKLLYNDNLVISLNQETHSRLASKTQTKDKANISKENNISKEFFKKKEDHTTEKAEGDNKMIINKNNKNFDKINLFNSLSKTPVVKISSIDTKITIRKDKTEGEVFEKVKFILKNGVFDSIVRKISLGGTSDRYYGFRLASTDILLIEAKVTNNCLESSSIYEHPYICVISKFDPIDATVTPKELEIEYEYFSDNLLRRRERPFSSNEQENVIVWIYDNYRKDTSIDLINLSLKFENKIDMNRILAYPEKFLLKTQDNNNNELIINWSAKDLKDNSFKNFALNIPIFNETCKAMNEVHLEITTYSVIQFFIWMTVSILLLLILSYVYISKKESKEELDDSFKENNRSTHL